MKPHALMTIDELTDDAMERWNEVIAAVSLPGDEQLFADVVSGVLNDWRARDAERHKRQAAGKEYAARYFVAMTIWEAGAKDPDFKPDIRYFFSEAIKSIKAPDQDWMGIAKKLRDAEVAHLGIAFPKLAPAMLSFDKLSDDAKDRYVLLAKTAYLAFMGDQHG